MRWLELVRMFCAVTLVFFAAIKWGLTQDPVWFNGMVLALILQEVAFPTKVKDE